MDNFGDFIWILFIIISIVSSLLSSKKKKEQERQRQEQESYNTQPEKPKTSSKLEETLRDIFGEEEVKTTPSSSQQRGSSESTWDPAKDYEDYQEQSSTNRVLEQQKELEEKVARIRSRSSSYSDTVSNILDKPPVTTSINDKRESYSKKRIVKMLRSPDTIKDLIIAQEILNKPKAFRD